MMASAAGKVTVLLVDDHAVVREGYKRLLERRGDIVVVGEAANAEDAHRLFTELSPQVVVMDIAMPGVSGVEAMRRMLTEQPDTRVLIFSMYEDAIFAHRALQAGACGYVTKASAPNVLVEAVHAVARGKKYISADVAQALALRNVAADAGAARASSKSCECSCRGAACATLRSPWVSIPRRWPITSPSSSRSSVRIRRCSC
jgi:DNA-binding NarL/FixJ family response regulator